MTPVIVVGGGLVGCVLSGYLIQRGFQVTIHERNSDPRLSGGIVRPSINLTLCTRGFRSLERVGYLPYIQNLMTAAYGRIIHLQSGETFYQPYSDSGEAIYSVRRKELNCALLNAAEERGVKIVFKSQSIGLDLQRGELLLADGSGNSDRQSAECIIAADGSHSTIRYRLQRTDRFEYSQHFSSEGYKELHIPAQSGGRPAFRADALHLWPRGCLFALAFANPDNSFTCSFHLPFNGDLSFASLGDESSLGWLLETFFPDLYPLLGDQGAQFLAQRPNSMMTIKCRPWSAEGRVLLIGDAAHAILPSYGQGANAGFQDCEILMELLDRHGPDWRQVFREFEEMRKPDTDAIADLCSEHFAELRELAGNPGFQTRRRLERSLQHMCPQQFAPLYSMISFSSMSYAEARRIDRIQQEFIDKVLREKDVDEKLNDPAFVQSLPKRLNEWLAVAHE